MIQQAKIMNKLIAILTCFLCYAQLMSAQIELSIEPKVAYTGQIIKWYDKFQKKLTVDSNYYPLGMEQQIRPMLDIKVAHHIKKNIYLTYGLNYQWFGHTFDKSVNGIFMNPNGTLISYFDRDIRRYNFHYLGVNLGVKYRLWDKFNFSIHGHYSRLVFAKENVISYYKGEQVFEGEHRWSFDGFWRQINLRPYQLGLNISAGCKVFSWMSFNVEFMSNFPGFFNVGKKDGISYQRYLSALTLSLAFDITLKKKAAKKHKET